MLKQPATPSERRRPRLCLSLRALMVLVLLLGCWLGWYANSVRVQREVVAAIKRAGGAVAYEWEWGTEDPHILHWKNRQHLPKWLTDHVGIDYLANVILVDLEPHGYNPNNANDATLTQVARLGHLKSLHSSNNTTITDGGLAHITGLNGLRSIHLDGTLVSVAGLARLKGMTQLDALNLADTRVTDDGVLEFEQALPWVQIHREEEMVFLKKLPAAIDDLDFARTQPIRLASWLLAERARVIASNSNKAEFIATIDALCNLEANDKLSLIKLAQHRAECSGILGPFNSPNLSASERLALQRCADRAIDALRLAVEKGYDNLSRLESERSEGIILSNLRDHPALPKLIETMKAMRPGR